MFSGVRVPRPPPCSQQVATRPPRAGGRPSCSWPSAARSSCSGWHSLRRGRVPWNRASQLLEDRRDELGVMGAMSLVATLLFFLLVQVTT